MSRKIENLKDLLIEQGKELYDTFQLEQKELPQIRKNIYNPQLRNMVDRQLEMGKNEMRHLAKILDGFNTSPKGEKNEAGHTILSQTKQLIKRSTDVKVRDAIIINGLQHLNHNNVSSLGSLAAFAREIGENGIAASLYETLTEEKMIDRELSNLAEHGINRKAALMSEFNF